jgi:erythromycin esterase
MMSPGCILFAAALSALSTSLLCTLGYCAQGPIPLTATSDFERTLDKGSADEYSVKMMTGESILLIVKQEGVDVVIDVTAPNGTSLDSVDSPTGRDGDEVVEIFAKESGDFRLRVRPIDEQEPLGKYRLIVKQRRSREEATAILASRQKSRDEATMWLAARSVGLPPFDLIVEQKKLPAFDSVAERAHVIGLGEATHGSREFGDIRLALTKRLIEGHGYRVVALEASASAMRILEPYVNGVGEKTPELSRSIESGWIGRRTRVQLIEWLRSWNRSHPTDRVVLMGTDAQENGKSREILTAFVERAYSSQVFEQWNAIMKELDAADEQTPVFGDSGVSDKTARFTTDLFAKLTLDAPILQERFGQATYRQAWQAAKDLVEFSDFNGEGTDVFMHSRDWYMAAEVLRGLEASPGSGKKVVYWAHNAHVTHRAARYQPTGAILRNVLGCKYAAVAVTFGEGDFLAQIPNDPEDRLAPNTLRMAEGDTFEAVLAKVRTGSTLASWPCDTEAQAIPSWLEKAQQMHWVGGLYKPGSPASSAFRSFSLLHDFDAIVFLPHVSADEIPNDRPLIPARKR